MAILIVCPVCATSLRIAEKMRGNKMFCPKCGQSMVITGAGVAKRDERKAVDAAPRSGGRGRLWLLLLLLALLVLLPVGLLLVYRPRAGPKEQNQVALHNSDPSPTEPETKTPAPKESTENPSTPRTTEPPAKKEPPLAVPEMTPPLESRLKPRTFPYLTILKPHPGPVWHVAFDPDDKILAAGSGIDANGKVTFTDGQVKLWNLATDKEIATLKHAGAVFSVVFGPDGKTLTAADWRITIAGRNYKQQGAFKRWDVAERGSRQTIVYADVTFAFGPSLALSGDGKTLACAFSPEDEKVSLWDVATGKQTGTLQTTWPSRMAFSPNGKMLASLSGTSQVELWEVATGNNVRTLKLGEKVPFAPVTWHVLDNNTLTFAPDNKTLAVLASSNSSPLMVHLWNVANGDYIRAIPVNANAIWFLAFAPDGKTAAVGTEKGIKFWEVASGKFLHDLKDPTASSSYPLRFFGSIGSPDGAVCAVFSHDGRTLAVGCSDGTVRLWRLR
jgi:WD40 repeat protein